jgi:NAD-dependent SIR2 family protein deacetylase
MGNQIQLNVRYKIPNQPWDPDEELHRAVNQRARFLEQYPQYKAYQHEIDRMLDKAGNSENRMIVLALLMEAKLVELHSQLKTLNGILCRAAQV